MRARFRFRNSGRLAFLWLALLWLALLWLALLGANAGFGQDQQCTTNPQPQCHCACRVIPSAISFAPRGTCRVIEPGNNSCQLRWFDASRQNSEPEPPEEAQRRFLDDLHSGRLGTKGQAFAREFSVDRLASEARNRDQRLPEKPTPLEAAAAYLAVDPSRQEPTLLIGAYLIMLGPALELIAPSKAGLLVDYLVTEMRTIFERVQSPAPGSRPFKGDGIELTDLSSRGCLELRVNGPISPERPGPLDLMVRSPRATTELGRCQR